MDRISLWCKTISLVSVLSSVFLMIIPDGNSKNLFKKLLSFVMIFIMIYPLSDSEYNLNEIFDFNISENNEEYNEAIAEYEYYPIIKAGEAETEKYIDNLLSSYDHEGKSEVKCDFSDGKLMIVKVIIYGLFDESDKERIKEAVLQLTDKETEIIFKGEEIE